MFQAHVLIVRRPKLYYTTSGIITPIGGRPVHRLREDSQPVGVRGLCHAPAALYPRERADTHCTGGWVGPRAGLDRCGKSRPHRHSIPGPSSP